MERSLRPLPGHEVDAFTWVAVLAEVGGGLLLDLAGLATACRQGDLLSAPDTVRVGHEPEAPRGHGKGSLPAR